MSNSCLTRCDRCCSTLRLGRVNLKNGATLDFGTVCEQRKPASQQPEAEHLRSTRKSQQRIPPDSNKAQLQGTLGNSLAFAARPRLQSCTTGPSYQPSDIPGRLSLPRGHWPQYKVARRGACTAYAFGTCDSVRQVPSRITLMHKGMRTELLRLDRTIGCIRIPARHRIMLTT